MYFRLFCKCEVIPPSCDQIENLLLRHIMTRCINNKLRTSRKNFIWLETRKRNSIVSIPSPDMYLFSVRSENRVTIVTSAVQTGIVKINNALLPLKNNKNMRDAFNKIFRVRKSTTLPNQADTIKVKS